MGNNKSTNENVKYDSELKIEITSNIGSAFSFNFLQDEYVMPYRGELNKMWSENEHCVAVFIEASNYIYGNPKSITVYLNEQGLKTINELMTKKQETVLGKKLLSAINNRNIYFKHASKLIK